MSNTQPLQGVRVLDLTRALAGPFCTTLLGDMGADVIKVESRSGDMIRKWGPYVEGVSTYHLAVNRNKRSIAVDLRSFEGKRVLLDLARQCDVLVENFRPGVLSELGLGPADIEKINPKLVSVSVSGFGQRGPKSQQSAFDQIAQGMSGLMSLTGTVEVGPTRVGIPITDILAGMFSALGATASLLGLHRNNHTPRVETSLLESAIGVLTFQAQRYLSLGDIPKSAGNDHPTISPYGVYEASDGSLNLAVGTDEQWKRLCEVIGAPQLENDSRFFNTEERRLNREELRAELNESLGVASIATWLDRFAEADLPAGPIHDMASMFADEQVQSLQMFTDMDHPHLGSTPTLRGPLSFGGVRSQVARVAPALGEHTEEILQEILSFNQDEIRELQVAEVIAG